MPVPGLPIACLAGRVYIVHASLCCRPQLAPKQPHVMPPRHSGIYCMSMIRPILVLALLSMAAGLVSAQTVQVLAPADLPAGARFGVSLSISQCPLPNGGQRLMAGAPRGEYGGQSDVPGNAYVFLSSNWSEARRLQSPDPRAGDLFGYSVHGNCGEFNGYLVGAPGDDSAYQFHRSTYASVDYVTRLNGSAAGSGSGFGYAVVGVGGALTVGAPFAEGQGAALIFPEYSTPGAPASVNPLAILRPNHPDDSHFGIALAGGAGVPIDGRAARIAVGAPGDGTSPGAVYVYRLSGPHSWELELRIEGPPLFGSKVAMGRRVLAVTTPARADFQGGVYIYEQPSAGTWTLSDMVLAGPDSPDHFGKSLWLSSTTHLWNSWRLLVGAPGSSSDVARPLAVVVKIQNLVRDTLEVELPTASGEYGFVMDATYNGSHWAVGDPSAEGAGRVVLGTTNIFPVGADPLPAGFSPLELSYPAPNPAGARTEARLDLPHAGPVRVAVFDLLGREVALVFEGALLAGIHPLRLDASSLAPGTYFLRVQSASGVATRRFTVLR
jgi:hypothetical protein